MDKRAILGIALSILVLIVYQEWVNRYYGPMVPGSVPAEPESVKSAEPAISAPAALPPQAPAMPAAPAQAAKDVRIETDHYIAVFTSQGARLKSFKFKDYRTSVNPDSPPYEMVQSVPGMPLPLGVRWQGPAPFDDGHLVYNVQGGDAVLRGEAKTTLTFQAQAPSGAVITKTFGFSGSSYPIQLDVRVAADGPAPVPEVLLTEKSDHRTINHDAPFEGFLALIDNKIKREAVSEIAKGMEFSGEISWAGFGYTYFYFGLLPENGVQRKASARQNGPALTVGMSGQAASDRYILFIGPKDLDVLAAVGRGMERVIDFGYFGFIAKPLLYVLHFFNGFTGSWGLDIILLTVIIKILLAPLTHKSFMSMKAMQKLQPQMLKLRERYGNDREKLNKEVMDLYRRHGVNPLGGCLPMVLQFPVFIGLYNALSTPIELRHAPFLWIKDLSRPDWESLPFELAGWHLGIPVLTILMGASMFVQQWMTPMTGDPMQRRLMLLMPLLFTFLFVSFPAGLTVYWLVNNVLSIGQQYWINRQPG